MEIFVIIKLSFVIALILGMIMGYTKIGWSNYLNMIRNTFVLGIGFGILMAIISIPILGYSLSKVGADVLTILTIADWVYGFLPHISFVATFIVIVIYGALVTIGAFIGDVIEKIVDSIS